MTKKKSPFFEYVNKWVAYTRRGEKVKIMASDKTINGLLKGLENTDMKNIVVTNVPSPDFIYSL